MTDASHLTDPTNKIYFASMEEGFYEVDVNTLAVRELWSRYLPNTLVAVLDAERADREELVADGNEPGRQLVAAHAC